MLFRPPRKAARRRSLEEENKRLRQLLHVTRSLVVELDQDRLLSSVIDTAIDLTGAERGFLLVFRGDDFSVEVARNYWRRDVEEPEIEISHHIAERVRAERTAVVVEDASEDERFQEFLSVNALKLRSVLCVPLLFRGEVKGVLYLDNRFTRGTFQEDDRDILQTFADLGAIALVNSGRFAAERHAREALRTEVQRKHKEILRAREALQEEREKIRLRYSYDSITASSPAMKEVLRLVDRVIPTDLTLLIEGDTGTGKEHLARIIHQNGPREPRPFVVVTCAVLPASLAEVELFGHAAGAYTDAGEAQGGLLEEAEGGTLFLEGIDDLDREAQALFLRVLETGEYRRVGEAESRRADVRVIASARVDLKELVELGRFREDLFFRLSAVKVRVPALAERPEDMPDLLAAMLATEAAQVRVTPRARKALLMRPWPGNLLELRNEIRRLSSLGQEVIDAEDLAAPEPVTGGDLRVAVSELEKRMIVAALQRHAGNRTRTSEELGLSRLGLRKKMQRFGLEQPPTSKDT
jgi:transcriptional regulator with GAF, ATPase, and Fis domain